MPPLVPSDVGWIPIAYGALDVDGAATLADGADLLVLPPRPAEPLILLGKGAALWRRLVTSAPVDARALTPDDNEMLAQMADLGLVTLAETHPARVTALCPPVLSSPLHELVYALVARVAAERGISCVFIKGPALHLQGLREREHSGDVDVWCDPARVDELTEALLPWGWRRAPDPWKGTRVHHTVTLTPDSWGCEIDVHRRFPGLVLDDEAAFEIVRRDAEQLRFADVDVLVPAADTHAVLAALHAVRPVIGAGRRSGHASATARAFLSRAPQSVARARELGAIPALRHELEGFAEPGTLDADAAGTPRDWVWREQPNQVRAYWMAVRSEPWLVRARLIARFVWPPDDVALASERLAGRASTTARRARWMRLQRGIQDWLRARRP